MEYLPGRFAFEILGHLRDTDLRWHGDKEVDVVFGDVTADDLDTVGVADLSNEVADSRTETARQDWFMVLGSPDEMIFAVVDGMRRSSIEFHTSTLPS